MFGRKTLNRSRISSAMVTKGRVKPYHDAASPPLSQQHLSDVFFIKTKVVNEIQASSITDSRLCHGAVHAHEREGDADSHTASRPFLFCRYCNEFIISMKKILIILRYKKCDITCCVEHIAIWHLGE